MAACTSAATCSRSGAPGVVSWGCDDMVGGAGRLADALRTHSVSPLHKPSCPRAVLGSATITSCVEATGFEEPQSHAVVHLFVERYLQDFIVDLHGLGHCLLQVAPCVFVFTYAHSPRGRASLDATLEHHAVGLLTMCWRSTTIE